MNLKKLKILSCTLLFLSTNVFTMESSALKLVRNNDDKSELILKNYRLSIDELQDLSKREVLEDDYQTLSLLFNTVDKTSKNNKKNNLILSILNRHPNKNFFKLAAQQITKKSFLNIDQLLDLYKAKHKIKGYNFNSMFVSAFKGSVKSKFKKYLTIPKERIFKIFKSKTQKGRNNRSKKTDPSTHFDDFKKINRWNGPSDLKVFFYEAANEVYSEVIKMKEVILPFSYLSAGTIGPFIWNGTYKIKASNCVEEVYSISNSLKNESVRGYSCDPGNYSKDGMAELRSLMSSYGDNNYVSAKLELTAKATGGYACENYGGFPRNCRDYTSYVEGNFEGKVKIQACENLDKCKLFYSPTIFNSHNTTFSFDGRPFRSDKFLISRQIDHEIKIGANIKATHTKGTGINSKKAYATLSVQSTSGRISSRVDTIEDNSNTSIHGGVLRPYFDFEGFHKNAYKSLEILNNFNDSPSTLNKLVDTMRMLESNSNDDLKSQKVFITFLYSILVARSDVKTFKNPHMNVAANILQKNASNKLRRFREKELLRDVEREIKKLRSDYTESSSTFNIIKNLHKQFQSTEVDFVNLIELVESVTNKDLSVSNLSDASVVMESLYIQEKTKRSIIYKSIVKNINELEIYMDVKSYRDELESIRRLF